jgi:hypothetical protein
MLGAKVAFWDGELSQIFARSIASGTFVQLLGDHFELNNFVSSWKAASDEAFRRRKTNRNRRSGGSLGIPLSSHLDCGCDLRGGLRRILRGSSYRRLSRDSPQASREFLAQGPIRILALLDQYWSVFRSRVGYAYKFGF